MNIYVQKLHNISFNNRYFNIAIKIIQRGLTRAQSRQEAKDIFGYIEGHHIIPISFCLGSETDTDNIVYLTAKEHIMVHRLMCKFIHTKYRNRTYRAFHAMNKTNGSQNDRSMSLHHLAKARQYASEANKGKRGIKGVPKWFLESDDIEIFKQTLQEYVDNRISDPKIGQKYGVSAATIHNWRNKLSIENRRSNLRNKCWLEERYLNDMMSTQEIADIVGCTGAAVQQYLNRFEIPIRTANERQSLAASKRKITS